MRAMLICTIILFFSGCAAPVSHKNVPMATYDQHTEYAVSDSAEGFGLTIYYSRYQFIPESDAVATACKSALTAIAWETADNRRKKIKPLNEQRIRISMGRNGLTGITSCQANAVVEWK